MIFKVCQYIYTISLLSHLNTNTFVPSLDEIGPVILEKKIFNGRQCILGNWLFHYYLPLEKAVAWNPFTKECFVPSLVEIGSVVLKKKIFKVCQCLFTISLLSPPWKRAWPFIWTNLNPHPPRMLCAKFS